jgi:hypothetical protein
MTQSKVKRVTRRFELMPKYLETNKEIVLGGYQEGEPPRVALSKSRPVVKGDAYGIYLTTGYIREIEPEVEEIEQEPAPQAVSPPTAPRRFELTPEAKQAGAIYKLGGYGAGDPPVVYLTRETPTVVGDAYAIYLGLGIIREAVAPNVVKQAARLLLEGRATKPLQAMTPERLVEEELERILPQPSARPHLDQPLVDVEELVEDLPSPEDLKRLSRPELEDLARRRGLWDQIQGTGPNGYRNTEDLLRFFGVEVGTADSSEPTLRPTHVKKMNKDELLALATNLDVMDEIHPTGTDGAITRNDLISFLVPLIKSRAADDDQDD